MNMITSTIYKQPLLSGIAFTAFLSAVGFLAAQLPGVSQIGPLAAAILLAVLYRHYFGYPEQMKSGIQFAAKKLLRLAIILFGLRLNMNVIVNEGLPLLWKSVLVIIFAVGLMVLGAKMFKADLSLMTLLGIGTGICGASAIAAVSPIIHAKEEDTAVSAGIISIVGTLFAIGFTVIRPLLPLDSDAYGMWAGLSLHEIANVALAGEPAGTEGLGMAFLAKLARVFLLVPVSLLLLWVMKIRSKGENQGSITFPWFLIGFIMMSLFGSYVEGTYMTIPDPVMNSLLTFTSFLLTMSMVGLGLSVSLRDVRDRALKPTLILVFVSILLAFFTYWIF